MGIIIHNVADALFSKVQQRVLGLLFGQPDRSFYTNEIIRLTHSGTGAVQRELAKLEAVGLITMKPFGNQKLYQVNRDTPLFAELHSIVLKTFGLVDVLKEMLEPITSQIHVAFVYGSIARREGNVNSDIDLMIIGDNISYADLYPLLETAQTTLGRQVNPTCYSPKEWARKHKEKNNFITQVINQPKIFLLGTENDLNQFG
jgi:predicted nucleotidyltransferase